jgi:thiosulfate/3-mercaptopyruvate sulfurtransferase
MNKVKSLSCRSAAALLVALAMMLIAPASGREPDSRLVSTEWLQDNLSQEDLRIIDLRGSIQDYWQNHIPGAVYLSSEALRLADNGVPGKLMPREALLIMLSKMGVNPSSLLIVYAENNNFRATYLLWALDCLGHPSAAMLEGGFDKWQQEDRPVTQDYPQLSPSLYRPPSGMCRQVRADLDDVRQAVDEATAVILDVRPLSLYTGEKGFWKRKGHIKGAIHHFWGDDLNEDGSWKSPDELKQVYEGLRATPEKTIITSCGQGFMSSHTYFALKYILGYPNVKNYDGSFNEWSNRDELPVETGAPK